MWNLLQGSDFTVTEGRDGWLFLKEFDGADVMGLYTDEQALPESLYDQWAAVLTRRRQRFAEQGITYLTLVIPDACLVYPDKLPDDIKLAFRSPFAQLSGRLDEPTRRQLVYPLKTLADGRGTDETFQSADSHWTDWGSWLGYLDTVRALKEMLPATRVLEPDDIEWSTRPTFGALGAALEQETAVPVPVAKVKRPSARAVKRVTNEVRHGFSVSEQNAPELPVAVILRDSGMTAPAKFFQESFRRTVFVASQNAVLYDLIEQEKPDVVIHELAERHLVIVPEEPSRNDFRWMVGDLLLDDQTAVADQRRSRSLLQAGQLEDALSASDDVLARVSPNARVMLHRARLHAALGRPDAAIEALHHATSLDPTDAESWFSLAEALMDKQRLPDATAAFARATELEPYQAAFWPQAIAAALQAGDLEQAAALSERAATLHPNSPEIAESARSVRTARDRDGTSVASRR